MNDNRPKNDFSGQKAAYSHTREGGKGFSSHSGMGSRPPRRSDNGTHGAPGANPRSGYPHSGMGSRPPRRSDNGTHGAPGANPRPGYPHSGMGSRPPRRSDNGTHGAPGANPRSGYPHSGMDTRPPHRPPVSGHGMHTPPGVVKTEPVSPARHIAFRVLQDVLKGGAYASLALNHRFLEEKYISPDDKRLASVIVYGVLEERAKLDYALSHFMEHPAVDDFAQIILEMAAYQILLLDRIPESAAVNEAVNQAKRVSPSSAAMINGVLRNLCRQKREIAYPEEAEDPVRYLTVISSTPEWLVQYLMDAIGYEQTKALLLYRDSEHSLVIRPNLTELTDEQFEKLLSKKQWQSKKGIAPHCYLINGASSITLDRDYAAGRFSLQGQSSVLAAEAMQVKPGMKVLDACAAPGGKSAYMCENMQLTGRVYACELHEQRAALMEAMKRRLALDNLRIMVRDSTLFREDDEKSFDAVLLDAPCSGLGVMAQKPDIKLRLKPEDIEALCRTQRSLLETVCRYVKPGGTLVYSTCSVLPKENTLQIQVFLENHPEYEVIPLPESFPEAMRGSYTPLGLQLFPYKDGVEGFFIARLRRKPE